MPGIDDMAVTDEQLAKLPKWAQTRIRRLEEKVETLRSERDLALGVSDDETNTVLIDHINGHTKLPPDSQIRFHLPWDRDSETWIDALVDCREGERPFLEIRAGRAVRIETRSSNAIRLFALTHQDV